MPFDLKNFKPETWRALFNGIVAHLSAKVSGEWRRVRKNIEDGLKNIAMAGIRTQHRLAEGKISRAEADLLLHGQELAMNQILIQAEFSTYELTQVALDAIFEVITTAIHNVTGVQVFRFNS